MRRRLHVKVGGDASLLEPAQGCGDGGIRSCSTRVRKFQQLAHISPALHRTATEHLRSYSSTARGSRRARVPTSAPRFQEPGLGDRSCSSRADRLRSSETASSRSRDAGTLVLDRDAELLSEPQTAGDRRPPIASGWSKYRLNTPALALLAMSVADTVRNPARRQASRVNTSAALRTSRVSGPLPCAASPQTHSPRANTSSRSKSSQPSWFDHARLRDSRSSRLRAPLAPSSSAARGKPLHSVSTSLGSAGRRSRKGSQARGSSLFEAAGLGDDTLLDVS